MSDEHTIRFDCCGAYGKPNDEHLCWGKCCKLAKPMFCVCAYAFDCPEHGQRHYGTHD